MHGCGEHSPGTTSIRMSQTLESYHPLYTSVVCLHDRFSVQWAAMLSTLLLHASYYVLTTFGNEWSFLINARKLTDSRLLFALWGQWCSIHAILILLTWWLWFKYITLADPDIRDQNIALVQPRTNNGHTEAVEGFGHTPHYRKVHMQHVCECIYIVSMQRQLGVFGNSRSGDMHVYLMPDSRASDRKVCCQIC